MLLYHYTSNAAFLSIIKNRELWATDLTLSNDRLEGSWIRRILCEQWATNEKTKSHMQALIELLDRINTITGALGVCLSTERDSLSQWRSYADDGAGVCVGFDSDYLATLSPPGNDPYGVVLKQIIYNVEDQVHGLRDFISAVEEDIAKGALKATVERSVATQLLFPISNEEHEANEHAYRVFCLRFLTVLSQLFVLKNPAFREEREWRLISHTLKDIHGHLTDDLRSIEYLAKADRIIMVRRIPIPGKNAVRSVVTGPRNLTPVSVFHDSLRKFGFEDFEITQSQASYR